VHPKKACLLVLSFVVFGPVSHAAEWQDHLATLRRAQAACRDINSQACLPYRAEAVAVADVLAATTSVSTSSKGDVTVTAVFRNGNQQRCSRNWLRDVLNGQRLMRSALSLDPRRHNYWVDALLAAAQQMCYP